MAELEAAPWEQKSEEMPAAPWEQVPRERGILERAGQELWETGKAGVANVGRLFMPPQTPEEVAAYRGPSGILKSLKETGAGILGPVQATLGAAGAGAESLLASGLGSALRHTVRPDLTSEQAYEEAKPYAGAAFSALGRPVKGGVPVPVTPKVPMTPEAKAGRTIQEFAAEPAELERKLAEPVTELVPGSRPTTYQHTGDLGLGQLERVSEARNQQLFQQRRAEQNSARLQAIENIQRTGSPQDVSEHLRDALRSFDEGIARDYKVAEARAWEEAQRLGGTQDPTTYGNILRRELQNAEEAARRDESALWQRVDPNGTLVGDVTPIQALERRIYGPVPQVKDIAGLGLRHGNMTQAGAISLTPKEIDIANLIQNYPSHVSFRELTDLRSTVSSAMREELMQRGRTPSYNRLSQMRSGIEDTVINNVHDLQHGELVADAAERLRQASAATRERAGKFNIPPIRDILRKEGLEGIYKVQESAIPGRLITSGPSGYENASAYLRAVGNKEGLPILQDAVAADMRRSVIGEGGLVDSKKLGGWMDRHQDLLRAIDERDGGGFSQRLRNAGDASDVLGEVAARRAAIEDKVVKSEFGKLIGASDPTDISRIIGGMFGSQRSVAKADALSRLLTTDASREGARRSIIDYVRDKFISNMEAGNTGENIIRADRFQTFVRYNRAALSRFFAPEQLNSWQAIAADLKRMNRSVQTKVRGGSNTLQDSIATLKEHQKITLLSNLVAHGLGTKIWGIRPIVEFASNLRTAARDAGIKQVKDLVDRAMLDPEIARDMLRAANAPGRTRGLKRWMMYEGLQYGHKEPDVMRRVGGGRVTKAFRARRADGGAVGNGITFRLARDDEADFFRDKPEVWGAWGDNSNTVFVLNPFSPMFKDQVTMPVETFGMEKLGRVPGGVAP